jgi:hypothetical protein
MRTGALPRRAASFVFTFGLFGVFAVSSGLIGYRPRRRLFAGVWSGTVLWDQVAIGVLCLALAGAVFVYTNRRLPNFDWRVEPRERRSLPRR